MKKLFFFFALVLLLSFANARALASQTIDIQADELGYAHVTEEYFFIFESVNDMNSFKADIESVGPSILSLNIYDSSVFAHIGKSDTDFSNGFVSFSGRGIEGTLEISYDLDPAFFKKETETSRETQWKLDSTNFKKFESGELLVIPAKTAINIQLPSNAIIDAKSISPSPKEFDAAKNIVVWEGYQNVNQLIISYAIKKPIAPTPDISQIIKEIFSSQYTLAIIVIIAVLCALIYWKRESISAPIEDYVVRHSEIKKKGTIEEEEIELE